MGKLVWAAIGFAAAVFAAEYLLPLPGLPYFAAALAVLSPAALLLKGRSRRNALLLTLSAAFGLLAWWGQYELHVAPCETLTGQEITVSARVTEYPTRGSGYDRVKVRITDGAPGELAYLYRYGDSLPPLRPGDEITATVRVGSAMERRGERRHTHTAADVHLIGYIQGDVETAGRWRCAWLYFPQEIAEGVKTLCAAVFPPDTAAFMTALLTGDKALLYEDAALYSAMRCAGVLHVVAVSGMHLFVLTAFLELILGRSRRTSLFCLPILAVFVLMAGCGASVVRAALMQTALIAAPLFDREYDGPSGIAAALLAILLANPMAIGSVALQLSFACVAGFVLFMPSLMRWMRRRLPMRSRAIRFVSDSLACTFCASVFSVPAAAHYFGAIPLMAWLANLLTLPVVEVCFAGGYIICAVGALSPPLGGVLGGILGWCVRWCVLVYDRIAAIPFGCLYTASPAAVAWLICVYVLGGAWWLLRRKGKRLSVVLYAELCVIGLCVVLLTGGDVLGAGQSLVTVLDVGQGECVLLTDDSAAVVVDCGGSARRNAGDIAADRLLSMGITQVDMLVLTHLHADHTNGVETLLARLPVRYIAIPEDVDDADGMLDPVLQAAKNEGTAVLHIVRECTVLAGDMHLTLLLPQAGTDENERGIVAVAELPELTTLIMGDAGQSAETALLERGLVPDTDVLVVGHHGAKTASGLLFLRAARAETAVISVGKDNAYGHPAAEVLDRLEYAAMTVRRTDEDGTVTVTGKTMGEIDG